MIWCAFEALSVLLDTEALSCTQIIALDEDPQCCGAFEAAIGRHESKHGPNCLARLCKLHEVSFFTVIVSLSHQNFE